MNKRRVRFKTGPGRQNRGTVYQCWSHRLWFYGAHHSNAYSQVCKFFPHTIHPRLKVVCGRNPAKVKAFAQNWGWEETETDWHRLIERFDIDLIDICSPNDTHPEIALAAAKAAR